MPLQSAREQVTAETEELRARLREAEETLRAIQQGEVDALVITERAGEKVYTLKSADRPYRMMIEGMGQGAVTLTADGTILYCNTCFAAMLKRSLESVIGGSLHSFLDAESRDLFEGLMRQEGNGAQGEVALRAANGTLVPAYVAITALVLEDGMEPVLCLVVTDLTEQKRREQIVADEKLARAAAEAANAAKDRFLATLSHELRTPLTPVLAVISALEANGRCPAELHRELDMVRRNVELEARLIDDLLDLTRISRGKLDLRRQDVDVRRILEHSIETCCGEDVAAGRLRVIKEFTAPDHGLWADGPRLTQVFWNLLSNAVKFTPAGGIITVRSWREKDADRLAVEVADTGVGIAPDLLPRIFDAFEQGEPVPSRPAVGLGLGLAISKAIVELHGGDLSVHSPGRNQGAVFTVRLPANPWRTQGDLEASSQTEHPRIEDRAPLHILLVEDHADTAEAMVALLQGLGHRITLAANVAEALAAAGDLQGRPDQELNLVVSDIGLPDGSGFDLMRELTRRYGLRGIALSGYGMEEDLRRSKEAGFERHLTKPINLESLQAVIHEVAGSRRLR
jgi:PAS domain S-box-containing protein